MSALKRSASIGPAAPSNEPTTNDSSSSPPRPATAAELRASISQLQAMLQILDSSIGSASSTSGWEDPFALDPADFSQAPYNPAKPPPSTTQGSASDSDGSDDEPLMQQSYSRPPTTAAPTPAPAAPIAATRTPFPATGVDTSQPLPSTGLVQQIEDLLVPLQAPNGAVLSHLDQAFSEFGMPSIETRYTTAMQRTQHLLQLLHAGTSRLAVPLPAALGPNNTTEPSPSPLSLAVRLLQGQSNLRAMRARNDHVRKRLRLGATAPHAVAPSTSSEPLTSTSTETSPDAKSTQPKLPAAVLSSWDGQWSYSRASVDKYLSSLQTWLEVSVPSTTPPGKKERNIRLRIERSPATEQMSWGTWIAHLTVPPAPEVYVSFMVPSSSNQGPALDPVNVTRITAHPAVEPQSNRPRPRPSGTPASPSLNPMSNPAPEAPEYSTTVDHAALLPGPTRALRKYEERLFGAVLTGSAMPSTASTTWTLALRARHVLSKQVHPPSQSTASQSNAAPSQDRNTVHVDEQVDLSPWNPLGRIVLELLAAGAA